MPNETAHMAHADAQANGAVASAQCTNYPSTPEINYRCTSPHSHPP